ncbi:M14 family metallopeptidase [Flagellimonas sp.]|uniref:M14 family metallopeptidase n=1 Tax=Flagellimonas sp. TaxID=2058762 RepID=UPI003BAD1336
MTDHSIYKERSIQNRYINLEMLEACLNTRPASALKILGKSVQGEPLYAFSLGKGETRILMWSQMHGNESTTTKAVWDMVNYLESNEGSAILETCTLMIVPMLNPDGAKAYTRVNANEVDLNRDAQELTQPESQALRDLFEKFEPHYCFNLHDQRTLFSAGHSAKVATVSFLSPANNEERDITPNREVAMKLIVAMNETLQSMVPEQVGRYDDGFNANCVGDTFQMLGVPTILFEAGHYPKDYMREDTRKYIFHALIKALTTISKGEIDKYSTLDYFKIPENEKLYYDILVHDPQVLNPELDPGISLGIRFKEVLDGNRILFQPELGDMGKLNGFYGHETFNCLDQKDLELLSGHQEILDFIQNVKK